MNSPRVPFFSIIIPVYNALDRLDVMLQGLLTQSCQDFEVIMVDDQSDDGSLQALRRMAEKYENFHLVELRKNIGCGPSRSQGALIAKGKYLHFHDADDWLAKDALKFLKNHLLERDFPDMTLFQFATFDDNTKGIYSHKKSLDSLPEEMDGEFVYRALCNGKINSAIWNKVFKRATWESNNLKFPKSLNDGYSFLPFVCLKMSKVTYCGQAFYHYYLNTQSITFEISDRQAQAPFEGIHALFTSLQSIQNYENLHQDFLRFSLKTFRLNFFYRNRNRKFLDHHVEGYIDNFYKFCQQQNLQLVDILGNKNALLLLEGFFIERRLRRLLIDYSLNVSMNQMEELFEHYMIISRQMDLGSSSGDFVMKQTKLQKREKSLTKRIQRLMQQNQRMSRNPIYWLGQFFASWYRFFLGERSN